MIGRISSGDEIPENTGLRRPSVTNTQPVRFVPGSIASIKMGYRRLQGWVPVVVNVVAAGRHRRHRISFGIHREN